MIRYTPLSFCTEHCELGTHETLFTTPVFFEVEVPVWEPDDAPQTIYAEGDFYEQKQKTLRPRQQLPLVT